MPVGRSLRTRSSSGKMQKKEMENRSGVGRRAEEAMHRALGEQ